MEQQCMLGHDALLQHIISPKLYSGFFWLLFLIKILNDEFDQHLKAPTQQNHKQILLWLFNLEVKDQTSRPHGQIHSFLLREKVFQKFFELVSAVISDQERVTVVGSSNHGWQTWNTKKPRAGHRWTDPRSAASSFLTSPRRRPEQAENFLLHVDGSSQFVADSKRRLRYLGNHNWAHRFKGQRSPIPS